MLKRFLPYLSYLKPVLPQFILAFIAGIAYGVSTGLGIPTLIKYLYPRIFEQEDISTVVLLSCCVLPIIVATIRGLGNFFNGYYVSFCGQKILEQLRVQLFDKLQALQLSYFHKRNPGELIARATSDTGLLQNALMEFAQEILRQPATLIGAIASLTYICLQRSDIVFLLVFLLAIPVCIVPIRITGNKLKKKAHAMQGQIGEITQRLNQNLGAVREIRSFCLEERESNRFQKVCVELSRRFMKVAKYNIILTPIIEVVAAVGVGFALWYAYTHRIPADDLVATALTLYLCYEPIKKLGRLHNKIHEGLAGLERVEAILHEPVTIEDPENPVNVGRFTGNIEFKNVQFAYDEETVLEKISQTLDAGKTYALVGPSGAGKTTFANLIPRFYDAVNGTVNIDGTNVCDMRLKDLRSQISLVAQDPVLFNETIYNNILLGNPEATQEQVIQAAKNAFAHEYIESFEEGYETLVGERGMRLSGGQKQRLAIARAFLKDAPILIMDEATSALDANSERFIQQALEKLIQNKTVILIAHRFSSIKHADEILVFDKGQIVERGTHETLFAQKGVYTSLYEKQIS